MNVGGMNGGTHEGLHGARKDGDIGAADGGEEGEGIRGHIGNGSIAVNCGDLGFLSCGPGGFSERESLLTPKSSKVGCSTARIIANAS